MEAAEDLDYSNQGQRLASSIAMTVVLVSFSMLFASLFLGYFYYRLTAISWPPMSMEKIELFFPTVSTFFIVLSSLSYYSCGEAYKRKDSLSMTVNLSLTIILGLLFLGSQLLLWQDLKEMGIVASSGIFPSLIYTFTWIHVAHIIVAILLLFWVFPITRKRNDTILEESKVINVGKFWHFLSVVWLVIYFSIFVF